MPFEINLPARLDACLLRTAGMEVDAYQHQSWQVLYRKASLPLELRLPYFLSDPPATVTVTMLTYENPIRLRIAGPSPAIERKIRAYLERYSAENDGEAVMNREHAALWKQINSILERDGLTYQQIQQGKAKFTRRAIDGMIKLSREVERSQACNIADLFSSGHVARADQEVVARWLLGLFAKNPDPFERGQLSLRIWENAVPQVGDEIIPLIENRKLGDSRACLLMALAKAKHPRAADIIASVLHEECMAWAGVQALAKLKATQHVDKIRRCLRSDDAETRREAKKALKKLGFAVETPPSPVHLVKGKVTLPTNLDEWSQNLDMEDVEPVLKKLSTCVDGGFGAGEIAEVLGVVEGLRPGQTRAFRFPVTAARKSGELWLVIFMDDSDSPDLEVHAAPAVLKRLAPLVSLM
jgi:hypothetical protein